MGRSTLVNVGAVSDVGTNSLSFPLTFVAYVECTYLLSVLEHAATEMCPILSASL